MLRLSYKGGDRGICLEAGLGFKARIKPGPLCQSVSLLSRAVPWYPVQLTAGGDFASQGTLGSYQETF